METATNQQTGARVYKNATGAWVPLESATNPQTGARVYKDETGNWVPLDTQPAAPAVAAAPPLDPTFTGENIRQSSLSRRALRDPAWPTPTGNGPMEDVSNAGEVGIPSELGMPYSLGPETPPWSPPVASADARSNWPMLETAFSKPSGEFPEPPVPAGGFPPAPGFEWGRKGKLLAQAVGGGLVNAVSMPVDIPILASKALGAGTQYVGDKIASAFGQPTTQEIFDKRNAEPINVPMLSDIIKDYAMRAANKLGYEETEPRTTGERYFSNTAQFASEGLGGAAILRKLAMLRELSPGAMPSRFDKYIAPYKDAPIKTMAGDTVAGAGAGAALTGTQSLPDEIRNAGGGAVGAGADLLGMDAGAISGGTLANIITKSPPALVNMWKRTRPAWDIPVDPVTKAPVTNAEADAAGKFMQANTSLPPAMTAHQLSQNAQAFRDQGLPLPSSGLLTDDQGFLGIDKRTRIKSQTGPALPDENASAEVRQSHSFGARDQALRDAASERVRGVRPEGVDAELFPQQAQAVGDARIGAADQAAERARDEAANVRTAREAPANELLASQGQTPGASADIHDAVTGTRTLENERSRALYQSPEWQNSTVDANPLLDAALNVRNRATEINPVDNVTEGFLRRIESAVGTGTVTGRELNRLEADIESQIAERGLKQGNLFRQLKDLKDGISETINALPPEHPGRMAIDAAKANFETRIAPNFRQGAGGALDEKLKSDRGQVYPETAGVPFVARGRDAEQLARIGELRGTQEEVRNAARTILRDQMTQQGVIRDGVIDPDRLQTWWNTRAHITQHVQGLDAEIGNMLAEARRGAADTARSAANVRTAETGLKTTTQEVRSGPLGMVSGKDPEKAVEAIMGSGNAPANMKRLMAELDDDGKASAKAAVSDWFTRRVSSLNPLNEHEFDVNARQLVDKFNQHRKTFVEAGFTPEDMNRLQQAQTLILPLLKRNVQATVGSTTAESSEAALRPLELALKAHYGILKGGGVMRTVKVGLATLKGDPTEQIERLITRAMFEPELAAALLTRDLPKVGTSAWNANLQRLIRRTEVGKEISKSTPQTEKDKQDAEWPNL